MSEDNKLDKFSGKAENEKKISETEGLNEEVHIINGEKDKEPESKDVNFLNDSGSHINPQNQDPIDDPQYNLEESRQSEEIVKKSNDDKEYTTGTKEEMVDIGDGYESEILKSEEKCSTADSSDEDPQDQLAPEETISVTKVDSLITEHQRFNTKLDELLQEFKFKIKYDQHKEKIIDRLHRENQTYKDNLLQKLLTPLIMSIIHEIDDIRKLCNHYRGKELTQEDAIKLFKLLVSIPSDMEEILKNQGVESFNCTFEDLNFDPKRQRVANTVETDNETLHKTIAEKHRPGYKYNGKVVRPEMVSVYVYRPNSNHSERRETNE